MLPRVARISFTSATHHEFETTKTHKLDTKNLQESKTPGDFILHQINIHTKPITAKDRLGRC